MTTNQEFHKDSTPLNRHIVKELGLVKGAVACKIIYVCNLRDAVCRMGQSRMADELGLSRTTVMRAVNWLEEEGYIDLIKSATATEPQHIKPSSKLMDILAVDVQSAPLDVQSAPLDVQSAPPRRAERTQDKNTNKKQINNPPKKLTPHKQMMANLMDLYKIDVNLVTEKQKSQLNIEAGKLLKAGKKPNKVELFKAWYYSNDWRGKQGQTPYPFQASELWGQFESQGAMNSERSTSTTLSKEQQQRYRELERG